MIARRCIHHEAVQFVSVSPCDLCRSARPCLSEQIYNAPILSPKFLHLSSGSSPGVAHLLEEKEYTETDPLISAVESRAARSSRTAHCMSVTGSSENFVRSPPGWSQPLPSRQHGHVDVSIWLNRGQAPGTRPKLNLFRSIGCNCRPNIRPRNLNFGGCREMPRLYIRSANTV